MKETIQKGTVFEEKIPEVFIDGEDTMPMFNVDELESHGGSAFHTVFVTTRGAKTAVAVERDVFKISTMRTMIHGTTKGGIPAVDHLVNIFHFSISGMESVFYFFIMVCKNFLQDIHKTIMRYILEKRNP